MWTWIVALLMAPFAFAAGYIVGQRFGEDRTRDDEFLKREEAYSEGFEDGKSQAKWEASVKAKKSKPKKITARKPKKAAS